MPGFQPHFSLIPDPDENKEDTSFISVVAHRVYYPLLCPIQSCSLPEQNFEKNAQNRSKMLSREKDPAYPAEPWIQDQSGFFAELHGVQIIS